MTWVAVDVKVHRYSPPTTRQGALDVNELDHLSQAAAGGTITQNSINTATAVLIFILNESTFTLVAHKYMIQTIAITRKVRNIHARTKTAW